MGYPLIVLGAGASFDCQNYHDFDDWKSLGLWQPPLANDLFNTKRFNSIIEKYTPQLTSLASIVKVRLSSGRYSFEEVLTQLRDESAHDDNVSQQLLALMLYLAELFSEISVKYFKSVNYYGALLHVVRMKCKKACFVNFNYDLLLEKNVFEKMPAVIDDYVSGHVKIVKIHGACNWYYERKASAIKNLSCFELSFAVAEKLINNEVQAPIKIINGLPKSIKPKDFDGATKLVYSPALAIPLQNKSRYVCPEEHIKVMRASLSEIDRVLFIGWRGGDSFLIEELNKALDGKKIPITIVGMPDTVDSLTSCLGPLSAQVTHRSGEGFSKYLTTPKFEEFFK